MANKSLHKIEKLDNIELIDLFKKNGYGEFEEVLRDNEVDGKKVFALKEFEVMRWNIPPVQRRRLWSHVVELLQNPQKFLGEVKPQTKLAINRKLGTSNQNIRDKLELVIGGTKPGEKSFQKPEVKVSPATAPIEDYLAMDKPIRDDGESPYDGDGYLLPTGQSLEVEENNYEPPPTPTKVTGFVPSRYRDFKTPIAKRAPKALPRDEQEIAGDYILGPEDPRRRNTLERRETSNLHPKVQTNHRNIPLKSARTPSPNKALNVPNPEDEDVEETYEPAPDVTRPIYSNVNRDNEMQDNESLSKKLKGFLLNTLGKKSPYEERKWNSLNIKSFRDKSPTDSVKSLEKDVCLKSRPLPPLPWEMEDIAPLEIYQNIREDSPNEDQSAAAEAVYSNEDLENNLATLRENKTLPRKLPSSYEPYRLTNNADRKKLPAPPNTLPTIPLNPQLLPSNQDEEELEEYNNAIFNINDEPYYRNTDRKGARLLLHDLEDGAFLFRPSKRFFLTLSLKYRGKYCNLGIEKSESNKIRLNTDGDNMSPEFPTLGDFVAYFTREYLTFQHDGSIVEVRLKRVLPHGRF